MYRSACYDFGDEFNPFSEVNNSIHDKFNSFVYYLKTIKLGVFDYIEITNVRTNEVITLTYEEFKKK